MAYRLAAEMVVLAHLGFIVFAILGGLLTLRWRRLAWLHVPALVWAALIEFAGWLCPLTPLENWLRAAQGALPYEAGFVDHYLVPLIYPGGLTREVQVLLGVALVAFNAGIYTVVVSRRRALRAAGR